MFIEIDFKEAEDYITETGEPSGVMKINDSILFFKYPAWIAKEIKGVSYIVVDVKSKFADGKFTQILDCVLNSFPTNDPNGAGFVGPMQEDNGEGREPSNYKKYIPQQRPRIQNLNPGL